MIATRSFGYRAVGALILAVALGATSAPAQAREEGAPAAALGLADTVRAGGVGASALFFNPAGMAIIKQYAIEGGYSLLQNSLDGHAFGVTAVDSATNKDVAMGMSYTYVLSKQGGVDRDGHNLRAALATGYATRDFQLTVGVGARYLTLEQGHEDSASNGEADDVEFITMDAGLIFELGQILRLGVVGQNLIDTKAMLDAPRKVGFGAAVRFGSLELCFDTELDIQSRPDETPVTYSFGAQYLFDYGVVARAGFVQDGVHEQNRFALGTSYVSRKMGVDLAYSRAVGDSDDSIFSASFKYFLP